MFSPSDSDELTEDVIPDFEERKRKAEMLENMNEGTKPEDEEYNNMHNVYHREESLPNVSLFNCLGRYLFKPKMNSMQVSYTIKTKIHLECTILKAPKNSVLTEETIFGLFSAIFASVDFKLCLRACYLLKFFYSKLIL